MAEFLKVLKLHRNCLKLFRNDQIGLCCWKNLSSECPGYILLHLQSLQDFTYMALKGLLCGIFVAVESHHIASESVETSHSSPNHCLRFGPWWCTVQRFVEFTYGSNILPLSFMWLNSWKFENCIVIAWNSSQMTEWVFVAEKSLFWILSIHFTAGVFVAVESHHNASESVESSQTSPNHCLQV